MSEHKKQDEKRKIRLLQAKSCLVLGGLGILIAWMYAMHFHPSPVDLPGRKYRLTEAFFDLLELTKNEPLGGIIAFVSALLIIIGVILLRKSGWKPDH